MSTGLIIAIVVAALLLIALAVMLPRMRGKAAERKRTRELEGRRERAATESRTEAESRARRAEAAEQKAKMAEQAARRERAESELHEQRAVMHERGLADDELIAEHERDRFAGVTGPKDDADRAPADDERARTD